MSSGQSKVLQSLTRPSARDLSSYQYHAMKIDTSDQIDYVDTSSAGTCIGILQNKPDTAGEEGEIAIAGTSLLIVTATSTNIAVGDKLGSDASYHGAKVSTDTSKYFAIALEASTADGDLIEVLLCPGNHTISA